MFSAFCLGLLENADVHVGVLPLHEEVQRTTKKRSTQRSRPQLDQAHASPFRLTGANLMGPKWMPGKRAIAGLQA
jgi:hypothetical protein